MCVNKLGRAIAFSLFFALAGCAARAFGASKGADCDTCTINATGRVTGLPYTGRVAIRTYEIAPDGSVILAVSTLVEEPISRLDDNSCRIEIPLVDPISGRPALGMYSGIIGDPRTVLQSLSAEDIVGVQVNLSRFARSKKIECRIEHLPFQIISANDRVSRTDGSVVFEVVMWQRKYK